MLPLCRTFVAFSFCGALVLSAGAGELKLPPIAGEISGAFTALAFPGAPKLQWSVKAERVPEGGRKAVLTIEGPGTRLRVNATADEAGNGRWSVAAGELDLAQWYPVAAPEIGEAAVAIVAQGEAQLSGGGELHDGQPSGALRMAIENGGLRDAAGAWSVEGLSGRAEFRISAGDAPGIAGPFEVGIRTITSTRFGARNFFARGRVNNNLTVTLSEARIEVAGGEVVVDAATIPLSPPSIDLNLRINNVGLQDIAALVPSGFSDARGRIDGAVRVSWDEGRGFAVGVGELKLGAHEPAVIRLASSPGFLTDHVPKHFSLLPAWAGPLGKWFRPENPAYRDVEGIELGQTELRVHSLSVRLTPEGDDRGRSASIEITAQPMQASSVVEKVTFQINVAGPLMHVVKLGLEQSFSVEVH